MVVAGVSGSGKTSLLKAIAGLGKILEGRIVFNGKPIIGPDEQLIPGNDGIAYLSQHFELQPFRTLRQIFIYANPLLDEDAEKDEWAHQLYRICQVHHLLDRRSDQLSGGERQRAALTKLLLTKPSLLLMDEPFSNLDPKNKSILKDVVQRLSEEFGTTVIMATHDPMDSLPWADKAMVLSEGQAIQSGLPQEIYEKPVDEPTAGLFGEYMMLDAAVFQRNLGGQGRFWTLNGMVLIRPHHLAISKTGSHLIPNYPVSSVRYFGTHVVVGFEMAGHRLSALAPVEMKIAPGQKIWVSLAVKNGVSVKKKP